ncbi:hypothetical protein CSB45_04040 [candidate division KSB3 bacterium]|uniref:Uncharacterized protein n=1 Tax=candidate division KSB3 bacterium TaxID=2044937 RepID=A0A2G6E824_9BACT|nr:MAG: hypothetical protein CSB45_04040 [candidate division KSB3 bacterium]PIE30550.1 MAG: hypothetical protein CSA57_02625 [candidate division KSB3 bacterium]
MWQNICFPPSPLNVYNRSLTQLFFIIRQLQQFADAIPDSGDKLTLFLTKLQPPGRTSMTYRLHAQKYRKEKNDYAAHI